MRRRFATKQPMCCTIFSSCFAPVAWTLRTSWPNWSGGPAVPGTRKRRPAPKKRDGASVMDRAMTQQQAPEAPPREIPPSRHFNRSEWAALRADTPLTLTVDDLFKLQSVNDPISVEEVVAIYLPLSRLLALYVAATQGLFKATQRFLGAEDGKMPYIIGIAGSVAVGKSTTARVLKALLTRWPNTPKVELITTDGFLHPNAYLEREGLMDKKGFPESYD